MDFNFKKAILLFALMALTVTGYSRKTKWNDWKDKETLAENLREAAQQGKTYFCTFKYHDYTKYGDIYSSRMAADLGQPFMYGVDFYQAMGNYLPEEHTQAQRKNIAAIVKAAWEKNRAIPVTSWHLHSPYAVYKEFKKNMGCRYMHIVEGYPQEHRYVINEILNHKQVDTLGIGNMYDWFDQQVRELADFINTEMVDKKGNPIPFIFRLWHEQQDSWAWWCYSAGKKKRSHVSVSDYKAFWRLTVEKFREYCPKAQILWCYGPDRYFSNENAYMKSYPGDDVVDIIGYDDYRIGHTEKFKSEEQMMDEALKRARMLTKLAKEHGKIAIIAESQCPTKDHQDDYFGYVQQILQDDQVDVSLFQTWSGAYYKEPTIKFIDSKNIIFDR